MKILLHLLLYIGKRHWLSVLVFLAGVAGAVAWFRPFTAAFNAAAFEQASTVLSAATLLVAVVIWAGETREDWEAGLPKRLKVVFLLADCPVLVSEGATLLAEGDLRALAQQLGRQLNQGKDLSFSLRLLPAPPRIRSDTGEVERLYEVRFRLTKPPEVLVDKYNLRGTATGIHRLETDARPEDNDLVLTDAAATLIHQAAANPQPPPGAPPVPGPRTSTS